MSLCLSSLISISILVNKIETHLYEKQNTTHNSYNDKLIIYLIRIFNVYPIDYGIYGNTRDI